MILEAAHREAEDVVVVFCQKARHAMLEEMSGTHSHRIPPKYFSDQSIDVREAFTVSVSREPFVTNDRINFSLSLLLDIREQRHGQEERVYRGDRLRIRRLSADRYPDWFEYYTDRISPSTCIPKL